MANTSNGAFPLSPQAVLRIRRRNLILGVACLLVLGIIYGFSMFVQPMMEDFELAGVGNVFYVMMICFCAGCILGSIILPKLGVRATMLTAAALFAIGFGATGILAPAGGILVLYIFYAVIGGLGVGIGYNTIVATVNLWFPDKVGTSSGILLLGYGSASLLCGNLSLALRGVIGSIGPVFVIIGLLGAGIVTAFGLILENPPANIKLLVKKESTENAAEQDGESEIIEPERFDDSFIFKTPIFYTYYSGTILLVMTGVAMLATVAADGTSLGMPLGLATLLVGLVTTCNGLARVIQGAVLDRIGVTKTYLVNASLFIIALLLIVAAQMATAPALYAVGALMCGYAYGGCPVVGSAFARKRFGAKKYPTNLAIITCTVMFASFFNIVLTSIVGGESRLVFFSVQLALVLVALLIGILFNRQWKRDFPEV